MVWQQAAIALFALYSVSALYLGYRQCRHKRNAYGLTPQYYPLGAFVWGDAVIFGIFWFLVSLTILYLADWLLFWLIVSVFWAVRCLGEMMYWFMQQFSSINRNPPEHLHFYALVNNDAVWLIYQIVMQCLCVVSIVSAIYVSAQWIRTF